jgi:UDP-2,4-diacetamido-2,4,6-trideoxy-beta-L-altropyranose hydrolase
LAQAWRDEGGEVVWFGRCEGAGLRRRLEEAGVHVLSLARAHPDPEDLRTAVKIATRWEATWVVADGYHFDGVFQRGVRAAGHRLLLVDDMAQQPYYESDILLNQNLGADRLPYRTGPDTQRLLGSRFVLLRREFRAWRGCPPERHDGPPRLLVTLGGSDPDNATGKVIQALRRAPDCDTRIVIGPLNPHADVLRQVAPAAGTRLSLLTDVIDMPAMMHWADLAVSAGGSTCWELAFMGVPMVVIVLAENQRLVAEALAGAGAAVNLGLHADLTSEHIAHTVTDLLGDRGRCASLATRGRSLVDGEGCDRVVSAMRGVPLRLRPVRETDCRLLWEWANDESVRAVSFTPEPIPWERHVLWFHRKQQDPSVRMYVAVDPADVPVGQVRFESSGIEATISVSLASGQRGRGLGSVALDEASRRFYREHPVTERIHAYIKSENDASVRAFRRAGFVLAGTRLVGSCPALDLIRERGPA